MSIFSNFATAARPAVTAAATAFVQDRTGLNLERLSQEAEQSRRAPLGTGAVSPRSAEVTKLAGDPGMTRFLVPVLLGVGLLVLVIAVKGK